MYPVITNGNLKCKVILAYPEEMEDYIETFIGDHPNAVIMQIKQSLTDNLMAITIWYKEDNGGTE